MEYNLYNNQPNGVQLAGFPVVDHVSANGFDAAFTMNSGYGEQVPHGLQVLLWSNMMLNEKY